MTRFLLLLMLCIICICTSLPVPAFAHGVTATTLTSKTAAIQFAYVGGEPMSYAKVYVYSPNSKETDVEFQNGRTDAKGNFAFVPDSAGTWRITASDMGHKADLQINVTEEGIVQGYTPAGITSLPMRIVLGISIILNLLAACLIMKRSSKGTKACE